MEDVSQETQDKQEINKPERDKNGRLLPGNTANPYGRPKRPTIKERILEVFEENPSKFEELVEYFIEDKQQRALLWQMLEGKPAQATDITSKGEKIMIMPAELINKNDTPPSPESNS
jgi:hypothetical protein